MGTGWIKLHRQLLDWEWYDDTNTKCLFLHCLLRANHSDTEWRGHKLKRGQFLTSVETLTREVGLTTSQVRTSMKKLISTNEIASKSQARSTVITVVGYDSYQGNDKQNDEVVTSKSQDNSKLIATDKNVISKECKNDKNKDLVADASPKFDFKKELLALGVDKQVLEDWLMVRKNKKASNTQTALTKLINQAEKAKLSVNDAIAYASGKDWKGFEAKWYFTDQSNSGFQSAQPIQEFKPKEFSQ